MRIPPGVPHDTRRLFHGARNSSSPAWGEHRMAVARSTRPILQVMKTNCRKKSLTLGEFIAAAHDAWGERWASGFVWLAANAHLVGFRGNNVLRFPGGISIASRFERTTGLKIQTGHVIRKSALVVLAVLSFCLPPFACGQQSAHRHHQPAGGRNSCPSQIRSRPHRTVQPGDVGFQCGADDRHHQTDEPGLSVRRRETGPDRNREFWPEPHLSGTIDQQSASGKVERRAR